MDTFVRDRLLGTNERVSVDSSGAQQDGGSGTPAVSADGRYVAFFSNSTNLVTGDTNGRLDIFVHDRQSGLTDRVSIDSAGTEGNNDSYGASISSDGRYAGFVSMADNLVSGDTNGTWDIFLRDRQNGITERVSVDSSGAEANGDCGYAPSVSADGRYVAFVSSASNLVAGDTNASYDVFVRDRNSGVTERVSIASGGAQGNSASYEHISISADGRYTTFESVATNLVSGDTNASVDDFVHDRDATVFQSLCEPGVDGVRTCPCGNPPAGSGQGCNNFAPTGGTGGARLTGWGFPSIAADTVSLDVSNTLKQIHVLFVGTGLSANVRTGAGVRCVGSGPNHWGEAYLSRLAKQTPTNGPPSTLSFSGIIAASAAKGVSPIPGETYYYYAAYRNSAANGQPGCPGLSFGFNATNAGAVTWYP